MLGIRGLRWCYVAGASLLVLGPIGGGVRAQTQLPSVSVDPPKQQTAQRAQPARRATRATTGSRRAVTRQSQQQEVAPPSSSTAGIERANGPVVGYLANQS